MATTNDNGAGGWRPAEYNRWLGGREIIILPDADPKGLAHGRSVAESLVGTARSIRIVELPGLGLKEDVYDWLGREVNQL